MARFSTQLQGHFPYTSTWNFNLHFKDGLYYTFQAFQNIQELIKQPHNLRDLNFAIWQKLTFELVMYMFITYAIFKSTWFVQHYRPLNHPTLNNLMHVHCAKALFHEFMHYILNKAIYEKSKIAIFAKASFMSNWKSNKYRWNLIGTRLWAKHSDQDKVSSMFRGPLLA